MEEKLEMTDKSDCRRYYQLIQEKVLPEGTESIIQPITFASSHEHNGDVEDLNLRFSNAPENQISSALPRKVKLKYFERDTEDEEEVDDFDGNIHGIPNGDGHYIMDDDAWSDYWDSGVDDVDHVFSKPRACAIDNEFKVRLQQNPTQLMKINGNIEDQPKNSPIKVKRLISK